MQGRDQDLEDRHQGDHTAADGGRTQHLPPLPAVGGNVVLARAPGVLGDLERREFGALAPDDADPGLVGTGTHLLPEEAHPARRAGRGLTLAVHQVEQQLEPVDDLQQTLQLEGQRHRHAGAADVAPDAADHVAALIEQHPDRAVVLGGPRLAGVQAGNPGVEIGPHRRLLLEEGRRGALRVGRHP